MKRWRSDEKLTSRCQYVDPNTGSQCAKYTSRPPYCWPHTEMGRPGLKPGKTRCRAIVKNGPRLGRQCINGTGGHESGLCPVHREE